MRKIGQGKSDKCDKRELRGGRLPEERSHVRMGFGFLAGLVVKEG